MNAPTTQPSPLRQALAGSEIVLAPGIYDALTALLVERAGFGAAYFSGGSFAYTRFGRPDIGLVGMSEVADTVSVIRERVDIPIIVDIDTGYGNALNVMRTVRLLSRIGAAALQIEDQTTPKRCGHLKEKSLVSTGEMVGKIKAALDARDGTDTLIIARTDAIAVEGFEAALERAERYRETGADMLFVEAPQSREDMAELCRRLGSRAPLMANMVEGGKTPLLPAAELEQLGYSLVIFPGGTIRAIAHLATEYLASLKEHGTTAPFRNRMFDFDQIVELVGTDEMLELGKRYERAGDG